jgi:GR25 family glycosyltransferase involved in LPS biosynthesis
VKLNLIDIPVYYINLDEQEEKRKRTETMLKQIGFKFVERFSAIKHEAGRIIGCARSHYEILNRAEVPFIILEDDCSLNKEVPQAIELPDNADALYLGISHWGRYLNHSGPYVHTTRINEDIVRVHNMLATHAILYLSQEYANMCKRISYHFGYEVENHLDIGFAEVHRFFNVYSFDEPLFRQYEWSAVTTGKLSSVSYNKSEADILYQEVKTEDENYYKLSEEFKSPIKPLIMKRDVNGIPGYFVPTRII